MRNLKRVLSLALASVMLLGMMVIGAGAADKTAADLTDMDKVTNKEAVSVMVDLGIIEGKPDGSFAPTEGVDRATMAKLITYVLMGDVDAAIFEGTSTDLTDIDTNWAEGYIKYCYANGIISGDGQGHFFPTQGVTVVQAAKMLLVALGYDADASKYQNNSMWSVNIMKDAQVAGLLNGVEGTANDTLTRDGAAQMIFNTLNAKTVTPKFQYDMGVQYLSEYVVSSTTLGYQTYGMVKVTATVTGIENGKAVLSPATVGTNNLAISKTLTATPDMVGNVVSLYVKGTLDTDGKLAKAEKLISTSLVISSTNVLGTSTDGTMVTGYVANTTNDLTTNKSGNKKYIAELDETVNYFENGAKLDDVAAANSKIKVGTVVELIDANNNGKADLVKLTNKSVKTLTNDVKTKTEDDVLMVSVPGVTADYVDAKTVSGYEGLVKNDVVLTVEIGGVTYIEKATSVEGVVTGIKNDTYKVDGVYYAKSGLVSNAMEGYTANDFKNTYTFYLDNGNNIVKAVKVTEETVTKTAVVLDYGMIGGGDAIGATNVFQAQILFEDGTVEVVEMSKFGGKTVVASGAGEGEVNYSDVKSNVGVFVDYSVDKNGKYELTKVTDTDDIKVTTIAAETAIKSNTAKFDGTHVANANTIFLVKKGTGSNVTYTAYKGIANVPAIAAGEGNLTSGQVVSKNGVATYVYLDTAKVSGDVSAAKYAYILNKDAYEVVSDGNNGLDYVYSAIVDGVKTTLTVDKTEYVGTNGLVTYVTTDGVVSEAVKSVAPATGLESVSGGTLVLKNAFAGKTAYLYNDDTVFYTINAKTGSVETVTASDIEASETVQVAVVLAEGTTNDTASVVFVITPAV